MKRGTAARSFANCLLLVTSVFVASHNASLVAAEVKRESSAGGSADWLRHWRGENKIWRGVHVMVGNTNAASELMAELPANGFARFRGRGRQNEAIIPALS